MLEENEIDVKKLKYVVEIFYIKFENSIKMTNYSSLDTLGFLDCNKVNDVSKYKNIRKVCFMRCKNIKNIGELNSIETLNLINSKVSDIGNLINLKELIISTDINGIQFLKNLKLLSITTRECYEKMKRRINKLKKINPNLKIQIIKAKAKPKSPK